MRISGSRRLARVVLATTVVLVVTTAALVVAVALRGPSSAPSGPVARGAAVVAPDAAPALSVVRAVSSLAVLRDWDDARARAWARGSPAALRRLYLPGSRAGRRDVRHLRAWDRRGLRVQGMRMQVSAVELRERTAGRLVLIVTDRVRDAVAVGRGIHRQLPRDRDSTRRLVLERRRGRWLMAGVYPARPVATTASPSGSANS